MGNDHSVNYMGFRNPVVPKGKKDGCAIYVPNRHHIIVEYKNDLSYSKRFPSYVAAFDELQTYKSRNWIQMSHSDIKKTLDL